jgi:hypothetical protein
LKSVLNSISFVILTLSGIPGYSLAQEVFQPKKLENIYYFIQISEFINLNGNVNTGKKSDQEKDKRQNYYRFSEFAV